jgi:hypothetical protein
MNCLQLTVILLPGHCFHLLSTYTVHVGSAFQVRRERAFYLSHECKERPVVKRPFFFWPFKETLCFIV